MEEVLNLHSSSILGWLWVRSGPVVASSFSRACCYFAPSRKTGLEIQFKDCIRVCVGNMRGSVSCCAKPGNMLKMRKYRREKCHLYPPQGETVKESWK